MLSVASTIIEPKLNPYTSSSVLIATPTLDPNAIFAIVAPRPPNLIVLAATIFFSCINL